MNIRVKRKQITAYSIVLLYLISLNLVSSACTCPTTTPSPPSALADKQDSFTVVSETIDGVDYGTPLVMHNLVYLKKDFEVLQSLKVLSLTCPTGYRAATAEEMQAVITNTQDLYTFFTNSNGFGGQVGYYYLTSTKSFPEKTDGTDADAWSYKALFIDGSANTVTIEDVNTYFEAKKTAKCIQDYNGSGLTLFHYPKDFTKGVEYPVELKNGNLVSYLWTWGTSSATTQKTNVQFDSTGCEILQVWAKNLANSVMYFCNRIYVNEPYGSDGEASLSNPTGIDTGVTGQKQFSLFFNMARTAIAPKPTGGLYLFYTDLTTKNLNVIEYDSSFTQVTSKDLGVSAYAFDAIAVSWGFILYLRDANDTSKAYLEGYNSDFSKKFTRVIMNNGTTPTEKKADQIYFSDTSGVLDGIQVMLAANNGKLAFGRGRIGLIFAHYNHFGFYEDGSRNDHTGDTFFTFDENGENEYYAWSWKTSHSLIQSHLYDGRFFVNASLGDVYPENINVCFVDMTATDGVTLDPVRNGYFKHPSYCKEISSDKIPGDGAGNSCGRLGGIVNMGNTYAVIYSIKPCSIPALNGGTTSTTVNELSMITFNFQDREFINVKKTLLKSDASKIVQIRAGKSGGKILVGILERPDDTENGAPNAYITGDESLSYLLVDFGGDTQNMSTSDAGNLIGISSSDEMKFLEDGTLAWAAIDANNKVWLYKSSTPTMVRNPDTTGEIISGGSGVPVVDTTNPDDDDDKDGNNSASFLKIISFTFILCLGIILS